MFIDSSTGDAGLICREQDRGGLCQAGAFSVSGPGLNSKVSERPPGAEPRLAADPHYGKYKCVLKYKHHPAEQLSIQKINIFLQPNIFTRTGFCLASVSESLLRGRGGGESLIQTGLIQNKL